MSEEVRIKIRNKEIKQNTSGLASGYVQTNVVIIPKEHSKDFMEFCYKNPKSCPLVYVSKTGEYNFEEIAKNSDIRIDVGRYKIFKEGQFSKEVSEITDYWREDFVTFLLGCSFTFENALVENKYSLRHNEYKTNVPMYITNIQCESVGKFSGNMVVSMRPFKKNNIEDVVNITSKYPKMHGSPVFICYSIEETLKYGIKNLSVPDFGFEGNMYPLEKDDVFVFWGCGVTPQISLQNAKLDIAITHFPGHMFIIDKTDKDYYES